MSLERYHQKRHFDRTPEPAGHDAVRTGEHLQFVVQKHAARRLHYDFRLELDGVLKSWAVPKGPSLVPGVRRLAVQTEDHPMEYAAFEGVIPEHEYGAGGVLVWDRGLWVPEGDPARGMERGKLDFRLVGDKLNGGFTLVRMPRKSDRKSEQDNWLLIKRRDRQARPEGDTDIVDERPESVLSGKLLKDVTDKADRIWHSSSGDDPPVSAAGAGPGDIDGARRASLPSVASPQLPTLVDAVPAGSEWFHEPKLDGYRLLCILGGGAARMLTRRGNDWSDRFPSIAEAASLLPCESAILDGEAAVFDAGGKTDFQALQNALSRRDANIVLVAFDLLYLNGWDLQQAPLRARKAQLRRLLNGAPSAIRYGDHVEGSGPEFFREACRAGLEGVVSKRADAAYRGRRTRSWLKIKCRKQDEFVIIGFTSPGGTRAGLGALLLGTRDAPGEALRYAGRVGTGFDDKTLRSLRKTLNERVTEAPPIADLPKSRQPASAHWVKPDLVADVMYSEWTKDGILRHSIFRGLREDKGADEVVREQPVAAPGEPPVAAPVQKPATKRAARKSAPIAIAGVKLTSPDKPLFPDVPLTKLDLARYYEQIAGVALPYLLNRPLTLLRCPEGQHAECFYQKHVGPGTPSALGRVPIEKGEAPYAMVTGASSLIALVQLGVLEIHVWGSLADTLEQPDIIVFDLDPDDGLPWQRVIDAALQLRSRLEQLGLHAFVRLTGGKGLHVVVPIEVGPGWDQVKSFSRAIAEQMVREEPALYTAKISKQRRSGKIFIDYLRNGRGATAIASYSPRAKAGAPVALPVEWHELHPVADAPPWIGVRDVPDRIAKRKRDPWQGFEEARRSLAKLLSS